MRNRKIAASLTTVTLSAASCLATVLLSANPAMADSSVAYGCPPDTYRVVQKYSTPTYSSMGGAAGKHNASTSTATLSVSVSLTTSRATEWSVNGGATLDWGIASVEAGTSYSVTKTTETNKTVTDTVPVPAGYYGYAQPKAEFQRFQIQDWQDTAPCGHRVVHDYGILNAIITAPFFSECVAKSSCTPTP